MGKKNLRRIDRSKWEPCELCGTLDDEIICRFSKYTSYDQSVTSRYVFARFCPECGRPLTEKACDELEKLILQSEDTGAAMESRCQNEDC